MKPSRARVTRELERLAALNDHFAHRYPGAFDEAADARAFAYRYAARLLRGEQPFVLHDDEAVEAFIASLALDRST